MLTMSAGLQRWRCAWPHCALHAPIHSMQAMHGIKQALDPLGLMNPGKVL